jgi:hypothetical protein
MLTDSDKHFLKNKNKNATTTHKNSLQCEIHSYTTPVLRKSSRIVHNRCNTRIKVLQKIAWPKRLLLIKVPAVVHESSKSQNPLS